jgi:hypothetical protein
MVHIDLWNDWAIRTDPMNWMLCKKRVRKNKDTKEDEDYWEPQTYHANLKQALNYHGEACLRLSEADSVATLNDAINDIQIRLDGVLTGEGFDVH